VRSRSACVCLLWLLSPVTASAQEEEPTAIVELGGAGEWGVRHGGTAYGPNLAAETTPIPDWLELEAGVTPFYSRGQTEWDTDFLFKKPFTLTDTVEFMAGVGPEWAHTVSHGQSTDSFGGEAALDFMFWPVGRRIGFYIEPSYGYDFGPGHDQTLSVSAGLLIAIP
jgi:hypothetical protein